MQELVKKYLIGTIAVVAVVGAVFLIPKKKTNDVVPPPPLSTADNSNNETKIPDKPVVDQLKDLINTTPDKNPQKVVVPLTEKQKLLTDLKLAADKEDYATFALLLKKVYDNGWQNEKDFTAIESAAYVSVDKKYFTTGDYAKSLEITTTVYNKVPSGWRFAYLRILTLEKLGRTAFEKGDLALAEQYALAILKMSFRLEGSNLLADVYIRKIEADIAAKNKSQAQADYDYIKDFEVSPDRTNKLNQLKSQIDKL